MKVLLFTLSNQELAPALLRSSGIDLIFAKSDNINDLASKLEVFLASTSRGPISPPAKAPGSNRLTLVTGKPSI